MFTRNYSKPFLFTFYSPVCPCQGHQQIEFLSSMATGAILDRVMIRRDMCNTTNVTMLRSNHV